ncbi:MAG: magnesium transporter [Alphaproteobacteria bacterium]|nr:MAG: magnesium transporter [Alphaproteobacteria bacterium]TAF15484.1 MAG: magnesium transporter [Alphaproteobacteria bacterium]
MPLHLYCHQQQHITQHTRIDAPEDASSLIWCDLAHPDKDEEEWAERFLSIAIPTREEMHELEPSNRFYSEHGCLYATISIMTNAQTPMPELHAVSLMVLDTALITLRYSEPYAFSRFAKNLHEHAPMPRTGSSYAIGLIQEITNRIADNIDDCGRALDALNHTLFRPAITDPKERQNSAPDFEEILRLIGIQADKVSKIRESLLSIERMVTFLSNSLHHTMDHEVRAQCTMLLKDIPALLDQLDALSHKTGFLLEAALGLVGIKQTAIIKIFSVVSVVFLPPTLVASIYGMNFQLMPELQWQLGYPLAILTMIGSAWLPYRLFKNKKWL